MNEDELQELLKNSQNSKISWHQKFLFKFWPKMAFNIFAKNLGANDKLLNRLHEAFAEVNRVDMVPLRANRGFMLILEGKISLWFYQDGDHFKYDGFEIGEYDKADVTIFDNLPKATK